MMAIWDTIINNFITGHIKYIAVIKSYRHTSRRIVTHMGESANHMIEAGFVWAYIIDDKLCEKVLTQNANGKEKKKKAFTTKVTYKIQ